MCMRMRDHGWNVFGGLFMCIAFASAYYAEGGFETKSGVTMTYDYDRIDEVKKACGFVLNDASELKPDDNRIYSIKQELSFLNGDWWQESNGAPLMPFDSRDQPEVSLDEQSPLHLTSFWVTDVDRAHKSKKSVSVNGFLQMGITLENLFMDKPDERNPHFDIWPGHSQLLVSFQGIYTESKENDGERVMCLLGETMLPARHLDPSDPWEWVRVSGYTNQPPLLQDDQVLLVLRYPKKISLTNRAVRGSMKSQHLKSNPKFFDEVHISSWLGMSAEYEFGSEKLVSKACSPYPYKDNAVNSGIDIYKGVNFCSILDRFTRGESFTIVPNWRCNGTDAFCTKLGPFMSSKEIKDTDGSFKNVRLALQDLRCEKETLLGNVNSNRVSAVFRAIPPLENKFTATQRTGLDNLTLSAEGIWKSSSGQLCMVGCLGFVDTEGRSCDSRICLYVPLSFSIKQRSIIVGTISSIKANNGSYFPLSFEKLIRPAELWNQYAASHPSYSYSKIDSAGILLEKNEPFSFGTRIKKSLLKFPKLEGTESRLESLSLLSEDLTLQVSAFPDPVPRSLPQKTNIQLDILSLGSLFGRYWSSRNNTRAEDEAPYHAKAEYTEKQLLLNVSAQLGIDGKSYHNFSMIFLEGLYNPLVGKMYLIGCRDVRATWKILFDSMDLEAGLDCLVEVVVSYPPTTARWLVNPTAKISISSQRNEDDPLYFSPVKLQTTPIMYRRQREDIFSRQGVEGILRVLTLSVAIACVLSQLFYINDNVESVPYISLVMLGIQAIGYSLPLVTGVEALFQKKASESYESTSYDFETSQWVRAIDYTVKILVLVAFSLTLRLCQKVYRSRVRLLSRSPDEPHRVPSDNRVIIGTLIVHIFGYVSVLIIHFVNKNQKPIQNTQYTDSTRNHILSAWETELEEYAGLVQDLFLFPQVLANIMWQINCRPLRKFYFIGMTVVRLLPHIYDSLRSPEPNPYFPEEYEFVNPNLDFYSKVGDIAIPFLAVLLAFAVYVQQRWNYEKLSQALTFGQFKLLPSRSQVYERLPSISYESELVSTATRDPVQKKDHEDE
ncbi:uncharacterized protein LOC108221142 [Daucus carota subsp. sativus]